MIPKDSLPSPRSTIHDLLPVDVLSPQSRQRDILPSTRQTTHDEDIAPRFEVFKRLDTVRHGFAEGFDGDARSRGGMNTDVVSNFIGRGESQFGDVCEYTIDLVEFYSFKSLEYFKCFCGVTTWAGILDPEEGILPTYRHRFLELIQ